MFQTIKQSIFNTTTATVCVMLLFVFVSNYLNTRYYEQHNTEYICDARGGVLITINRIGSYCLPNNKIITV